MTAKQIIKDYHALKKQGNDTWLGDCKRAVDILVAIEMAGMARDLDGDKHPHQHRLPHAVLRKFTDRLLRLADALDAAKTFNNIYDLVEKARPQGIGPLTIYDTAQRIGVYRGKLPKQVYLHRGTKTGAERYLGKKLPGKVMKREDFPDFSHLSAGEVEDILCIYKDYLPLNGKVKTGKRGRC